MNFQNVSPRAKFNTLQELGQTSAWLGLPERDEYDDGFAEQYESMPVNHRDVELAKRSIEETAKTLTTK